MAQLRIESVLNNRENLPRKQKALCDYIVDNINEAEVLTVKQLAERAGVGDATVFRFLKESGYDSYSEFREELHRYAVEFTRSSYWQMKASLQKREDISEEHSLYRAVSSTINLIGKTITPKLLKNFDTAVEVILSSAEVGVFGLRSSKAVALYFYYLLLPLLPSIRQFSHDEHYIFEQISQMPKGSTMIIVTSWPNTQTSIAAADFCHQMGHKVILVTNSLSCPIASYADLLLVTPEAEDQYTIIPYITVLEALANEIALRMKPKSIQQLTHMDEVLAENNVTNWIREKRP